MMNCNKDNLLLLWSGELSEQESREVLAHLAQCPECLKEYMELLELETEMGNDDVETAPQDFVALASEQVDRKVLPISDFLRKPMVMYPSLGGLAAAAALLLVFFGPWTTNVEQGGATLVPTPRLATYSNLKAARGRRPIAPKNFSYTSSFQVRTGKLASRIRMAKRSIGTI